MYEDRLTDVRCHEWTSLGPDLLEPTRFYCEFKTGHKGMHFAAHYCIQGGPQEPMLSPDVRRWGTEEQLGEEMRMRSKPYPAAAL